MSPIWVECVSRLTALSGVMVVAPTLDFISFQRPPQAPRAANACLPLALFHESSPDSASASVPLQVSAATQAGCHSYCPNASTSQVPGASLAYTIDPRRAAAAAVHHLAVQSGPRRVSSVHLRNSSATAQYLSDIDRVQVDGTLSLNLTWNKFGANGAVIGKALQVGCVVSGANDLDR